MKAQKPLICFDLDFLLYQAACVCEKSYVSVRNLITGEESEFKSRTDFWGHWKNKSGGALAEINKSRTTPYLPEDFVITDGRRPEDISNAIHILNSSIKSICSNLGSNRYYGYTGRGNTFRMDLATLLPYKGNRTDLIKPFHLEELKDYASKKHNIEIVKYYEADDYCSMDAWRHYRLYKKTGNESDKLITVAVDKDARGVTSYLFNPNKMLEPLKIEGLGSLYRTEKEISGHGRAWFYFQICNGDTSDNYDPACLSSVKSGEVSVFNTLKDCKTDKEYWIKIVQYYKNLYPEPVTFTNFRGDALTVNWLYVLQEMANLAWMKRWDDDQIVVTDILNNFGIEYEKT